MTPAGLVPVQHKPGERDYNHYLDKQIRPLADGTLFALDLTFNGIIEGEQLDLFGGSAVISRSCPGIRAY